jgi:hypothetical protein
MAIYGATSLSPNNVQIYASTPNIFSLEYQGTLAKIAYTMYIYKNSDNTLVYGGTPVSSSNEYHVVPSGTLTNNTLYKWKVKTTSSDGDATSQWVIFKTAQIPTFTLGATPTSVQTYDFSVLYNSPELIPIKWYRAMLYSSATPSVAIDDSDVLYPDNLVYSSATPLYTTFDGMVSGNSYKVRFVGENQLGYALDTGLSNAFTISYTYPPDIPSLITTVDNTDGSITLNWASLKQILGYIVGTSSYTTGKFGYGLQVNANSYLYYDTESIPNEYTAYFWIKIPSGYNGIVFKLGINSSDETGMQVGFNGTRFIFKMGEYITCGRDAASVIGTFCLVGVKYGQVLIKSASYEEILSMI